MRTCPSVLLLAVFGGIPGGAYAFRERLSRPISQSSNIRAHRSTSEQGSYQLKIIETSTTAITDTAKTTKNRAINMAATALGAAGGVLISTAALTGPAAPFVLVSGAVLAGVSGVMRLFANGDPSNNELMRALNEGFKLVGADIADIRSDIRQTKLKLEILDEKINQILVRPYAAFFRVATLAYQGVLERAELLQEKTDRNESVADGFYRSYEDYVLRKASELERQSDKLDGIDFVLTMAMAQSGHANAKVKAAVVLQLHQLIAVRTQQFAVTWLAHLLQYGPDADQQLLATQFKNDLASYHEALMLPSAGVQDWAGLTIEDLTSYVAPSDPELAKVLVSRDLLVEPVTVQSCAELRHIYPICVNQCTDHDDTCLKELGGWYWWNNCEKNAAEFCSGENEKESRDMLVCCPGSCQKAFKNISAAPCQYKIQMQDRVQAAKKLNDAGKHAVAWVVEDLADSLNFYVDKVLGGFFEELELEICTIIVDTLGKVGSPAADTSVLALIRVLENTPLYGHRLPRVSEVFNTLRIAIARALGEMSSHAAVGSVKQLYRTLLLDQDDRLGRAILNTLGKIGTAAAPSPELWESLQNRVKNPKLADAAHDAFLKMNFTMFSP